MMSRVLFSGALALALWHIQVVAASYPDCHPYCKGLLPIRPSPLDVISEMIEGIDEAKVMMRLGVMLMEHDKSGVPFSINKIQIAYEKLYRIARSLKHKIHENMESFHELPLKLANEKIARRAMADWSKTTKLYNEFLDWFGAKAWGEEPDERYLDHKKINNRELEITYCHPERECIEVKVPAHVPLKMPPRLEEALNLTHEIIVEAGALIDPCKECEKTTTEAHIIYHGPTPTPRQEPTTRQEPTIYHEPTPRQEPTIYREPPLRYAPPPSATAKSAIREIIDQIKNRRLSTTARPT